MLIKTIFNENYSLLIKTRLKNKRTNLGNIYFENIYIIDIRIIKAKNT